MELNPFADLLTLLLIPSHCWEAVED